LAVSRQVRCRGGGRSGIENAYLSYSGFKPFVIEGGYMDLPYTLAHVSLFRPEADR